jgi:hypothetical protein
VVLNDDNLADIQAEYEGPGAGLQAAGASCTHIAGMLHLA